MPSPTLTRRALLAGAGATVSSAALAVAIVPAVIADEPPPIDPEIAGLTGLPLAAVHIERAVEAMADFTFGRWQVTITSGDRDQWWGFKQINPRGSASDPLIKAIGEYHAAMAAYANDPIVHQGGYTDEEYDAAVVGTYSPALEALQRWDKPALTRDGAVAALQFAAQESKQYAASEAMTALMAAALAYFENNA